MSRWVLLLVLAAACGRGESEGEGRGKGGSAGSGGATDAGSENNDGGTTDVAGSQGRGGESVPMCVPGASQLCYCAAPTRTGAQVCADDGARWEECVCEDGLGGSAGAAGDGGSSGEGGDGGSGECPSGHEVCGDVCMATASYTTDAQNCGRCGNVCSTTVSGPTACANGQCGCMAGYMLCDGDSCVDTTSDPNNCGTCGARCPSGQCSNRQCVGGGAGAGAGGEGGSGGSTGCDGGLEYCPGVGCVDLSSDESHCGFCGESCNPGRTCIDGHCPT